MVVRSSEGGGGRAARVGMGVGIEGRPDALGERTIRSVEVEGR